LIDSRNIRTFYISAICIMAGIMARIMAGIMARIMAGIMALVVAPARIALIVRLEI
jgi:hypothetical protein